MPIANAVWSGAVVLSPGGDSITSVEGTWKVPSVPATSDNQNGEWSPVSCWIGIDGYRDSTDVLQAGCDVHVPTLGTLKVILWYEWAPNSSVTITDITASVGDEINVTISANPGMQAGTVVFRNLATGQVSPAYSVPAPAATTLMGNCAEWIVEALERTPNVPQLARFTTVEFANCRAGTSRGVALQPGSGEPMYIVDINNPSITIAQGDIVDPTTVRITYV